MRIFIVQVRDRERENLLEGGLKLAVLGLKMAKKVIEGLKEKNRRLEEDNAVLKVILEENGIYVHEAR